MNARLLIVAAVTAIMAAAPAQPASAQSTSLRAQCVSASSSAARVLCENIADGTVILQPRAGIVLAGGNPVAGSASTMGLRLGSLPRTSVGLRVSATTAGLPPIEGLGATSNLTVPLASLNADASLGVFQGFSLLPTVGGFGSIDLLASVGVLPAPGRKGFDDGWPRSWAAGVRVGILRESFTAPGVSIDLMHRRIGDISWGSEDLSDDDAWFNTSGFGATSLRATAGKRFLGFGLTGGVAWDRASADVQARIRDTGGESLLIRQDNLTTTRTAVFGNASLTILILNLAAELGWQQGGEAVEGASDRLQRGSVFGGLAFRVAI
ncbi:MAG TPA: hypothetical protein VK929_12375 [Longimicrobiales bacterium]|nr:hypothetical protein [Longimicrobiales bacterium]